MSTNRPITILIAALGGEGGGVLADWIVQAAQAEDFPVQATSVPGVAQRTGATTYYIEIFPQKRTTLAGQQPIFALLPTPGDVDVMLASELLEAGRAAYNGFVTPDRTLLIASTHRVLAVAEKTAMGDGRYDPATLLDTVQARAAEHVLLDLQALAQSVVAPLNAVLLGALAGTGKLPISRETFAAAIRAEGKSVDANLAGFEAGIKAVIAPPASTASATPISPADFDDVARPIIELGVARLLDYQNQSYAQLYLDRLQRIRDAEKRAGGDGSLLRETARQLALRMAFEDVIRVAQFKIEPGRFERVRHEVRAKSDDPMVVIDYFKPGIEELCSILPPALARPILRYSAKRGWLGKVYVGMHVRSNSILGFLRLRLLASLRWLRPRSYRYGQEQTLIEIWLGAIERAAVLDLTLAREIAELARLIKGYGETHARGLGNFERIMQAIVAPALSGAMSSRTAVDALTNARVAALADAEGKRLTDVLASIAAAPAQAKAAE
jgi:indolepyruvate ferredoxin oxidoreductase beta subunit